MKSLHKNCACIVSFSGHQGDVTSLTTTSNGDFLFSGGRDHSIRMWNIESGRFIRLIKTDHSSSGHHHGTITALYSLQNDKLLLSASLDGYMKVFRIRAVMEKETTVLSIENLLAGLTENDFEWDSSDEGGDELLQSQSLLDSEGILNLILSPDGTKIGVSSTEANLRVYEVIQNSFEIHSLVCQIRSHTAAVSCLTSNSRSDIVSASHDHHILITDSVTHCVVCDYNVSFAVNAVIVLHDVMLIAGCDYAIHLMSTGNSSCVCMRPMCYR